MNDRELGLLDALTRLSGGVEWVEADTVASAKDRALGLDSRDPGVETAVGAGLVLSRLARQGRCEKRLDGYMNRYRSTRPDREDGDG